MRLYLFNITNPDEVMLGDKPILREIGPYTWKIHMDKFDINFHPNYTLSYRENKRFEFLPDQSVGTYDDIVTTVNVPYAVSSEQARTDFNCILPSNLPVNSVPFLEWRNKF